MLTKILGRKGFNLEFTALIVICMSMAIASPFEDETSIAFAINFLCQICPNSAVQEFCMFVERFLSFIFIDINLMSVESKTSQVLSLNTTA